MTIPTPTLQIPTLQTPSRIDNTADLLSIEILNEDKKMTEYSTHPLGIKCVINNNFNLIHGGNMTVVIQDGNTKQQCSIEVSGVTKNKIINLIANGI